MILRTLACLTVAAGLVFTSATMAAGPKTPHNKANATVSVNKVYDFTAPGLVPIKRSVSTLLRNNEAVALQVSAAGLDPESAYTLWWVIWNEPQKCAIPFECSEVDLGVEGNALFYATGRVSDAWGQALFTTQLTVGEDTDGMDPDQVFIPGGLTNKDAEMHVILRSHGPAGSLDAAGVLDSALDNLIGGCNDDPRTPATGDGPGPNDCEDQAFAVHRG